ncbi:Hypothetical predicted protein [Paramuricea clavata]|uniref:Uncharacterized protein n=1 Tax=Paramuricea clavata TaxID=317549 RepID=A0A7D9LC72_PARCT|nr:Hypothetical predicted protein [Paramuricea clavata]
MVSWSIKKKEDGELLLVLDGEVVEENYGKILDVSVPTEEEYEDEHVQMLFSMHGDEILSLNNFEVSEIFRDVDCCSSHDFVARWNTIENRFGSDDTTSEDDPETGIESASDWDFFASLPPTANTSTTTSEDDPETGIESASDWDLFASLPPTAKTSTPVKNYPCEGTSTVSESKETIKSKAKRREMKTNVSGRQRGILAYERDNNKGLFRQSVVFGGEGWPPPFRPLVQEMRDFLFDETGLKKNWDKEDANMLRKYFYMKYTIPMKNTSVLTLHAKLATMSPRCYQLAQKVMDMYQSGQLKRKRSDDSVLLAVHATYFDFLYKYNVLEQEDDVYALLNNICIERKRPERRQNSGKERKLQADESEQEELKEVKNALKLVKEEMRTTQVRNKELQRKVIALRKELVDKENTLSTTNVQLQETEMELRKTKEDNQFLATSLATESKRLSNIRKTFVALQKENERMRKSRSNEVMSMADPTADNKVSISGNDDNLTAAIGALRSSHKRKSSEIEQIRQHQSVEKDERANSTDAPGLANDENEIIQSSVPGDDVIGEKDNETSLADTEGDTSQEQDHGTEVSIQIGDWVATDFGTSTFYVGKVTKVCPESKTAEAMFLKKHVENKYKESKATDKGVESFAFEQLISANLDVDYLNRGIYKLNNYRDIENLRLGLKKGKKQKRN